MEYLIFGPIIIAVLWSAYIAFWLKRQPKGSDKMEEISKAIQEGSSAYLKRQYKTIAIVAVILGILIYIYLGSVMAIGFLIGGGASALAGYLGMKVAVKSNSKTAKAAEKGMGAALSLAFKAGSVTGFLVVALGLLAVAGFVYITKDINALVGLGFGASLISIFARLGGGIYTKAADVGADLVGKVEKDIPEDDIRNPAVIADNVGDNVGDCAGMAADLFETYAVTLSAAMLLIAAVTGEVGTAVFVPLIIGGLAIVSSILGSFFVKLGKSGNIMGALYKGFAATIIFSLIFFYIAFKDLEGGEGMMIFWSSVVGLAVTILMVLITDYYTAKKFRPVKSIAEASKSGHGTNVIMGLSVGQESVFLPILVIVLGIFFSYWIYGLIGIAIATVSMLSVAGMVIAIDSFGPITDNAGGIAEMAGAPAEVRKITDALDAVGNTTKAVTKGYAIASAGLGSLALFSVYTSEIFKIIPDFDLGLDNPKVLIGLILGGTIPFLFSSYAMKAVGLAASAVVEEVRRQFREIKGIMEGTGKPDYGAAVDIVTKAALKKMIMPAIIPIVSVLIVGFFIGAEALAGFLIGSMTSGLFLGISMTTGGAAWDNAKKYIESAGGKGSDWHKAAVTGDTVGDPYKDTAGPAINPLIKVINIVALLIIPFIL
ncbi:MAG: sodium-translocating pyrophosphatase [Candidatus Pacebacteria bacterium]|nr:sodium-translocating pyrophosphatase [Candidatus Paceibacterota bacterium]